MVDYSKMTPYELGESCDVNSIDYIIEYLKKGNTNEKRLAASAIRKLSTNYKEYCNKSIEYLLQNLQHSGAQVRQYSLKALKELDLKKEHLNILKDFMKAEKKDYNIRVVYEILKENDNSISKENYDIRYLSNLLIMEYFNGKSQVPRELVDNYKKAGKEFIELLYEAAGVIIEDKILMEIFCKRYDFNDKYYTIQGLSKYYGLPRNYIEESIEENLLKIGNVVHKSEFNKLYRYVSDLLRIDEKLTFIERLVLFLYYAFPKSHLKIIVKLIMIVIYNEPKEWKQESVISSYNKFLDNMEKALLKKDIRKLLEENIYWPESIKPLEIKNIRGISTIGYLKRTLHKKGLYFKSEKMNSCVYYKSLYQKEFLLKLELLEEVDFYSTFNFKLKEPKNKEDFISDVFFVFNDGKAVLVLTPPNEQNLKEEDKNKEEAFKKLCKEKGLGLLILK
ncbi:hypothetical protein [Clostridium amazonitimonense]|uniref:hypothetical protein n=1 Tax=Clostridium amazonitimonense TaxID=1499689 RepID=UPI00068AE31C|nr:hypothetical protein [Clostridium amazonitimonense]